LKLQDFLLYFTAMESFERDMLKRAVELSEKNNQILRSMQRSMRISKFFRLLYWLIVIGIAIVVYFYALPYVKQVFNSYGEASDTLSEARSVYEEYKGSFTQ